MFISELMMPAGKRCVFLIYLCFITLQFVGNVFGEDVCSTYECIKAAELIQSSMDMNVDPCDDFYDFACGGFISNTEIPKNSMGVNSFSILKELTFTQVHEVVSEKVDENDIEPFRMAKQFFNDCLDEKTILIYGLQPIASKLRELGGWPIAESSWNENEFSWINAVQKSRNLGFTGNFILSLDIDTNLLNSGSRILYISPPDLGIPVHNLRRSVFDDRVKLYFKLMVNLAKKFGVPVQKALVELGSVLEFEIQLAKFFPTISDKREDISKNFQSTTISEIQQRFPSIDWIAFIQSMLNPSVPISEFENVVVAYPEFIFNLQTLLESTSKRTLANYFLWRVLFYSFNSYLILSDAPRWKNCAIMTSSNLNLAVASMYVRRHFKDESRRSVIEISRNIKRRMHETLSNSYWIDDTTKKLALEKINLLNENIGYPDILLDDGKIEDFYKGLIVQPGQYYESLLAIKQFVSNFSISTLKKPVVKNDWLSYENPLTVNGFYALHENSIKIPITLLQRNMFSPGRPHYLNYGAIGQVVGHEISHAFDDQGSWFDKDGNFRDWWSAETKEKYNEKIQCFVDQYKNYFIEGTTKFVNGKVTLGENIADNDGIREAYRAYEAFVGNNGSEPGLPGLDFTPKQLFWISAANVWCSKYLPQYLDFALNEDLHAPDKIRIIGSFSNQHEFARDFGCAVDSPMNPNKKCSLWD